MNGRRALVVLVLLVAAGCAGQAQPSFDQFGLFTRDGPPGGSACPNTSIEGRLVTSAEGGLALDLGSNVRVIQWPPRYGGGRIGASIVLLDENQTVVAHLGDRLRVGGWDGPAGDGTWQACRPVVLAASS